MSKALIAGIVCLILAVVSYMSLSAGSMDEAAAAVDNQDGFTQEFVLPTPTTVNLPKASTYYLYHNYRATVAGTRYDTPEQLPDGVTITVTDPDGKAVTLISSGTETYTLNDEAGALLYSFPITAPGDYTINAVGGELEPTAFEVTDTNVLAALGAIGGGVLKGLAGLALAGLFGLIGIILVIVGLVTGSKPKNAPA